MDINIVRTPSRKTCTIGMLFIGDSSTKLCYILENIVHEVPGLPIEEWKQPDGRNAIPAGTYEVVWNFSAHFQKEMPELLNVPGFAGVRIHGGNRDTDSEGCLITGSSIGDDGESVVGSAVARDVLYVLIKSKFAAGEKIWLTIG